MKNGRSDQKSDHVQKVIIPSQYNLLVYGGAGGLHALLEDIFNISTIIIPYTAGIFSATGIGIAPIENIYIKQINLPLSQCALTLAAENKGIYMLLIVRMTMLW
ncbi:MAG: hypothetical protein IPG82_10400 [Saprospiraceae bacterium]|nr:hypothetical protein [Saprospiraceae bacterium]